jgi:hypothetical protein
VSDPVVLAALTQERLDRFGVQVAQRLKAGPCDDPPDLAHRQGDIFRRVVRQGEFKGIEMPIQRSSLHRRDSLIVDINHAGAAKAGFIFEPGRELLGHALVGETLRREPLAAMIAILDGVGLVLALATLEN